MDFLLHWVLGNMLLAGAMALVALVVSRCRAHPALAHGLWVLVLLKMITPPLVTLPLPAVLDDNISKATGLTELQAHPEEIAQAQSIRLPASQPYKVNADETPAFIDDDDAVVVDSSETVAVIKPVAAAIPARRKPERVEPERVEPQRRLEKIENQIVRVEQSMPRVRADVVADNGLWGRLPWRWLLLTAWVMGSAYWFSTACKRIRQFQKVIQLADEADPILLAKVSHWSQRLRVPCPRVSLVSGLISPMLWVYGWRARLLLPRKLWMKLPDEQREALVVHELAHWRRGDHWIRRLELVVLSLYWWCPLAWWASKELRQAEEECCDAWVVWALPEAARAYAMALVETLDFLADSHVQLPPLASGVGQVHSMRRRLTMIMRGSIPRALTASGLLGLLGLGLLLLPLGTSWAQDDEGSGPKDPIRAQGKEGKEKGKRPPKRFDDDERPPPPRGDRKGLERRLDEMEHRLHDLLHDLHDLRRELGIKGHRPPPPRDGKGPDGKGPDGKGPRDRKGPRGEGDDRPPPPPPRDGKGPRGEKRDGDDRPPPPPPRDGKGPRRKGPRPGDDRPPPPPPRDVDFENSDNFAPPPQRRKDGE